ncbi:MAG: transketolase [Burkholderiaceae bacterium]
MNDRAHPQSSDPELTRACADALRMLAVDAVQAARSGHPGAPMGMAEMAVALWQGHLRHDPADPNWPDRDRFVLSNGHASMLLYGLLHLSGYDLPIEQLRNFRQFGSMTPGHPEVGVTPGVETTTGPLGQGLANAVGMALAERQLAGEFNRDGHEIVDHRTFVFVGDGCLMEGVSHEVCGLAGALRLNKLVALYDDNGISIDGPVQSWFIDDTPARFRALGWRVIGPLDGHDVDAIDAALIQSRSADAPTLIVCRTAIGKGSPNRAGLAKAHGEPLGDEEVALTRKALGWRHPPFEVPDAVRQAWDARAAGRARRAAWSARFDAYRAAHPQLAAEFERRMRGKMPAGWDAASRDWLTTVGATQTTMATRKASQEALGWLATRLPEMFGGSADLTGSNLTDWPDCGAVRADSPGGRHVNYGVREFGMAAIMNGLALHGGLIPFGGTFLTFSDYSRNALRMAALMRQRVVHVLTHDSIGLGEDGPTHQPVEHVASLRLIPGLDVWRPCDALETAVAWHAATSTPDRPSALVLSRQNLAALTRDTPADLILRGGYVFTDAPRPCAVIVATGSEVALAVQALTLLAARGIAARLVSMPCVEAFERQSAAYRAEVLPAGVPTVAVEAGVTHGWWRYVGREGRVLGIDRFGESAPAAALFEHFGFTPEAIAAAVLDLIG